MVSSSVFELRREGESCACRYTGCRSYVPMVDYLAASLVIQHRMDLIKAVTPYARRTGNIMNVHVGIAVVTLVVRRTGK
jgi:hypothetical protein